MQLSVLGSVESSLKFFLISEYLIAENKIFCDFCSKLQSAFSDHAIIKIGHYLIIQLKIFLDINDSVTKNVQSVEYIQVLVVPIYIDVETIHRKRFTLLVSVNVSGNLKRGLD